MMCSLPAKAGPTTNTSGPIPTAQPYLTAMNGGNAGYAGSNNWRSPTSEASSKLHQRSVISAPPAQRHLSTTSVASSQHHQRSVISAPPA
ncbi:hypothetical protein FM037_01215 [Shewanella psychropiezotolerans]|uniref:Uncharacterized protein n=2 Tax=Shewanella TaxID=22 RepID=A0ABX5WT98_9GAMM|nr:hypothetical protein [Shewanella psychropiezotolerans]QDO82098.1 hypothetical protein FM037_01215 [Shewanella psychropiezotolerans]